MAENKNKVIAILDRLNDGIPDQPNKRWITLDGYHAFTRAELNSSDGVKFYPGSGLIVKIFVKPETGEIRVYPAAMFETEGE